MDEETRHIVFHDSTDQELLAVIGSVAMAHGHVDYMLKMAIKNFKGKSIQQARVTTARVPSWKLRRGVLNAAQEKQLPVAHMSRLEQLLERCKLASDKRNAVIHGI
jgi:hypothetical protein